MMFVISRIRRWLYDNKIRRLHLLHRSKHLSSYSFIDSILERFKGNGGLKHEYQAYKLFHLRQLLDRYKPASILELGSGSSTAIFAGYVKSRSGASICSIDESELWLANAKAIADIKSCDPRFVMRGCARVVSAFGNLTCVGYGLSAERQFDFVFVDGPSLRINGVRRKDAINDDVFRLADAFPPRIIVVDGRHATVRALERHLAGRYAVERTALMGGMPGEDYNYFSIFERV